MGMVCYAEEHRDKKIYKKDLVNNNKEEIKEEINEENKKKISKKKEKDREKKKEENEIIIPNEKKSDKNNDIESIYEDLLKQHNNIRKIFHVQKLVLNDDLKILAQKFADNFDIIKDSNLLDFNYKDQPLGINYKIFKEDTTDICDICKEWINEKEFYIKNKDDYTKNDIKYCSQAKHFTQIIWKKTKEVGFGYSQLNNDKKIFVALYFPAGNIFDEFNENVSLKYLT